LTRGRRPIAARALWCAPSLASHPARMRSFHPHATAADVVVAFPAPRARARERANARAVTRR
jgi:hypothetical protein